MSGEQPMEEDNEDDPGESLEKQCNDDSGPSNKYNAGPIETESIRILVDVLEYQCEMIFMDPENSSRHWETLEVSNPCLTWYSAQCSIDITKSLLFFFFFHAHSHHTL
jgi:hypothetical protein